MHHCPLGDDIPSFLKAAADGDWELAYEINSRTNPVGDILGAACTAPCHVGCMLTTTKKKIADHISPTQREIYERAHAKGKIKALVQLHDSFNDKSMTTVKGADRLQVSSVGAGIAVHAPILEFIRHGAAFAAYDGKKMPGGTTAWGLPGTKLERKAYSRHTNRFGNAEGMTYITNTRVGIPKEGMASTTNYISFHDVAEKSDIVYIATGLMNYRWFNEDQLSREKQQHFVQAVHYIETTNKVTEGDKPKDFVSGKHNMDGKKMAIVGGGDTAWDAVGQGLRQGALSIDMFIRRDKMKGLSKEYEVFSGESENIDQETIDQIIAGTYKGNPKGIYKEFARGVEEARAVAKNLGRDITEILRVRLETEIKDVHNGDSAVEALTLKTPEGEEKVPMDAVVLAMGASGHNLKAEFEFSNDNFQMKKGNRLPVTQYFSNKERVKRLGFGHGHGGGVVGIFQTASGRKVLVLGVGDITRDDKGLDYSDEQATLVNAVRDGINVTPEAKHFAENREEVIEWAEEQGLMLNYSIDS